MKKRNFWVIVATITPFILAIIGAICVFTRQFTFALDQEYYTQAELTDITVDDYQQLIANKKSFLLFVDQTGCDVATMVRGFVNNYSTEQNISFYRVYFTDIRGSSINNYVKYYPSVVLISQGKVVDFLKANSNDHAALFTDYNSFKSWLNNYLEFNK